MPLIPAPLNLIARLLGGIIPGKSPHNALMSLILFRYPYYSSYCYNYVEGCPANDKRLRLSNWQQLLIDQTSMPIFQDTEWQDIWEIFGGGHNDIFIYDRNGRLYEYICSYETCGDDTLGELTTASGFDAVKEVAVAAASSNATARCKDFDDDLYTIDYYYYYGDDESSDDDARPSLEISDQDAISARIRRRRKHGKTTSVIPASVHVAVIALCALIISLSVLYFRYRKRFQKDEIKYTLIPSRENGNTTKEVEIAKTGSTKLSKVSLPPVPSMLIGSSNSSRDYSGII